MITVNLHDFDLVVLNSSGGKDSLVSLWAIAVMAKAQKYPLDKIIVSHQDLRKVEWSGTKELAIKQANLFGFKFYDIAKTNKDGSYDDLLEYVRRRGKWPSNTQRYCTSDFKRDQGGKIVRKQSSERDASTVLHVFGFRSEESPSRSKKPVFSINKRLSTKTRTVVDFLVVHDWTAKKVWKVINLFKLPYHEAYDFGMPRLSCVFCIFSPFDALVTAGYKNPLLLDEYIAVEDEIGHTFRNGFSLKQVRDAIERGYKPGYIKDWVM